MKEEYEDILHKSEEMQRLGEMNKRISIKIPRCKQYL